MPGFSVDSAVAAVAVLFAGLGWVYAVWCHRSLQAYRQRTSAKFAEIEKLLTVYSSGSVGIGHRLQNLEQHINQLQQSQGEMRKGDLDFSYVQAQKLVEEGIDTNTIVASCGLSASEVALMQLVHQQRSNH